ncbi:unnamed protein product [Discosporangium mesarthrocarpum]
MVCSKTFSLFLRRHHCRRCGACVCGACSHTNISDKILATDRDTGTITRHTTDEAVRCCTPCTRVVDKQIAGALQRRGWGPHVAVEGVVRGSRAPRSSRTPPLVGMPGNTSAHPSNMNSGRGNGTRDFGIYGSSQAPEKRGPSGRVVWGSGQGQGQRLGDRGQGRGAPDRPTGKTPDPLLCD